MVTFQFVAVVNSQFFTGIDDPQAINAYMVLDQVRFAIGRAAMVEILAEIVRDATIQIEFSVQKENVGIALLQSSM